MKIAIDRNDAFAAYRHGICDNVFRVPRVSLPAAFVPELKWREAVGLHEKYSTEIPLHCLVAYDYLRRNSDTLKCGVSTQAAALSSFVRLNGENFIVSPEMCAFGIAKEADLVSTVFAITELCSAFSLVGAAGSGYRTHLPFSTLERMNRLASQLKYVSGLVRFREACQLSVECAASPMEAVLALLLCLPEQLGGYGLPRPLLNPLLLSDGVDANKSFILTGAPEQGAFYGDLVFEDKRIVIEYASKQNHEQRWDRDMLRANELLDRGFTVMSVTPSELFDQKRMHLLVGKIARQLGLEIPLTRPGWNQANIELRSRLFAESGLLIDAFRRGASAPGDAVCVAR